MATINKIHVGSSDYDLKAKELTSDAIGTTQAAGDNSTKIATTAFVQQELPQGSLDINFNGTATGTTQALTNVVVGDTTYTVGGGSTNLYMHKVSVKLEPMMDPSSLAQDHIAYFSMLGTDSITGANVGAFSIINKSSASIGDKLTAGTLGLADFFEIVANQGALVYIGLADSSTYFYLQLNCAIYDISSQAITFGGWDFGSGSYLEPGQYYFYADDIGTLNWTASELETIALSITE